MSLYTSGWTPRGIRKSWECTSMDNESARPVFRKYGVPEIYGTPTDTVAWFEDSGVLRAMIGDFGNGIRADVRVSERRWTLKMSAVPNE